MVGQAAPTAIVPSAEQACRPGHPAATQPECAPGGSDRPVPNRSATPSGELRRPRPHAEIVGGVGSWLALICWLDCNATGTLVFGEFPISLIRFRMFPNAQGSI